MIAPTTYLDLDDPDSARQWLAGLGVRDPSRGYRDLRDLAGRGLPAPAFERIAGRLGALLPGCSDPGMALTNLDRFVAGAADPQAIGALLARDGRATEILIQLFSTSQHFSDLLIREPELLAWLRSKPGRRDRDALVEELWGDLQSPGDEGGRREVLRRFRRREMLRIGFADIVRDAPLEVTVADLSHLAEACVEGAYRVARAAAVGRHGEPGGEGGRASRFVVLALGKLGGEELNYSSDIDLIFLYDVEGQTDGPRPLSNAEFYARMGGEVVRLLADHTALGMAYRVDMRLRPEGAEGPLARSMAATLGYYETSGRTWERQALIKCRPIAGDLELGRRFLAATEPFVYRRYLAGAEIGEIKAMKRRIEQRTVAAGTADLEVKTGRGGIRDVEFVVQFLQLLHGGAYPQVRHPNTLAAIARLEAVGCLAADERAIAEETYRFLRRVEHRLQTMFDQQTHQMPTDPEALRSLAVRMGFHPQSPWEDRVGPSQRFLSAYRAKTDLNRKILNHLLHDAFRDDDGDPADPVVDLVLDPSPDPELIEATLGRYPFRDRASAYRSLQSLAREENEFLSEARCRHFLAAIAPRLLAAVAGAPDPDMALTNLEKVSASLGAKAILWELFNFNGATLRLFVDLCATSQFLSEILINNPGMIDDLMDSLVVDRPQTGTEIRAELEELARGAEDLSPILLGFRNKEWVRIGTRDILGREPIRVVTRELADVASAIVGQVARDQYDRRAAKLGEPRRAADGKKSRWAILGLGKLGGRELTYQSDLDLVFLFEADGATRGGPSSVPNDQFYTEVVRRLLRALGGPDGAGPLYAVDARLRPHGGSGPLVMPLEAFRDYYRSTARPWERLALVRARVIHGEPGFGREVRAVVRDILEEPIEPVELAREVVAMRRRLLAESRGSCDLKRGPGGLVEIEFLIQYLQILMAAGDQRPVHPNTWDALESLARAGALARADRDAIRSAYDFLRAVESRLRLVQNRSSADLPERPEELARLAQRLGYRGDGASAVIGAFRDDHARHSANASALFERLVAGRVAAGPASAGPAEAPST